MTISRAKSVTVVGVGRLGLCTALCIERAGYQVLGVDVLEGYVNSLNDKSFISKEPNVVDYLSTATNFRATTSLLDGINHSDLIYIMVDTPSSGSEHHYDVSKLGKVLRNINALKPTNKHIVVGCTVMPGYCKDIGSFLLKDCENTTLSYNPEFIQQGDIIQGLLNPDMVLIGEGNEYVGDILEDMYRRVCQNNPIVHRMSPSSAEICKLAINCFVTTKISYANMIGDISDRTPGAVKEDILGAIGSDSRVGGKCLKAGYGFGGPCFPRDNRALGAHATRIGVRPIICTATDSYNDYHASLMVEKFLLSENGKKDYTFSDVAYKPNCAVPIIEESQKLKVASILAAQGCKVTIKDRDFIIELVQQEYGALFQYEVIEKHENEDIV